MRLAETFESVDDYIASCPVEVQLVLEEVRDAIRRGAPGVVEAIAYNMPTFKLDGRSIVHFSAWKNHVGVYPSPTGDEVLERELERYETGKGTLRFPLDEPMPTELIERIATCLAENHAAG